MKNKEIEARFDPELVNEAKRLRNRAKNRAHKKYGSLKQEWKRFKQENYKHTIGGNK